MPSGSTCPSSVTAAAVAHEGAAQQRVERGCAVRSAVATSAPAASRSWIVRIIATVLAESGTAYVAATTDLAPAATSDVESPRISRSVGDV